MNDKDIQLSSAGFENGLVEVRWNDGSGSAFHPIWLRDKCRCDECGNPAIGYRNLRLTEIAEDCLRLTAPRRGIDQ